jgi:hypothetical protein
MVFILTSALLFQGAGTVQTDKGDGFELDHFFVAVAGPEVGSKALEDAGFQLSPSNPHPGQGTESQGILFENAYLELIWLTSAEDAASPPIQRTRLLERMQGSAGTCPFGIGLRPEAEGEANLPFDTWEYRPPYLPEGLFFMMGANSTQLSEPLTFFMPWLRGPGIPPQSHPNGAKRVTRLELVMKEEVPESETLSALSRAGVASFIAGPAYLMKVELDEGRAGRALDLRPEVPLLIQW